MTSRAHTSAVVQDVRLVSAFDNKIRYAIAAAQQDMYCFAANVRLLNRKYKNAGRPAKNSAAYIAWKKRCSDSNEDPNAEKRVTSGQWSTDFKMATAPDRVYAMFERVAFGLQKEDLDNRVPALPFVKKIPEKKDGGLVPRDWFAKLAGLPYQAQEAVLKACVDGSLVRDRFVRTVGELAADFAVEATVFREVMEQEVEKKRKSEAHRFWSEFVLRQLGMTRARAAELLPYDLMDETSPAVQLLMQQFDEATTSARVAMGPGKIPEKVEQGILDWLKRTYHYIPPGPKLNVGHLSDCGFLCPPTACTELTLELENTIFIPSDSKGRGDTEASWRLITRQLQRKQTQASQATLKTADMKQGNKFEGVVEQRTYHYDCRVHTGSGKGAQYGYLSTTHLGRAEAAFTHAIQTLCAFGAIQYQGKPFWCHSFTPTTARDALNDNAAHIANLVALQSTALPYSDVRADWVLLACSVASLCFTRRWLHHSTMCLLYQFPEVIASPADGSHHHSSLPACFVHINVNPGWVFASPADGYFLHALTTQ